MKLQDMQKQWWYRLLKVIYYSAYVISLMIWFFIFPLVILFYEFIRGAFFYVIIWDWNWQFERKKKFFHKLYSYLQKDGVYWLSRLAYNLMLFIILLPGLFLGISLLFSDLLDAVIGGIIILFMICIAFFVSSFHRFHNIWISGKNIWWLIFPVMNIIYIGKLVFQKEWPQIEKHKKESVIITLMLLIIILWWVIGFHIFQFYSLQNRVDSIKSSDQLSNFE